MYIENGTLIFLKVQEWIVVSMVNRYELDKKMEHGIESSTLHSKGRNEENDDDDDDDSSIEKQNENGLGKNKKGKNECNINRFIYNSASSCGPSSLSWSSSSCNESLGDNPASVASAVPGAVL